MGNRRGSQFSCLLPQNINLIYIWIGIGWKPGHLYEFPCHFDGEKRRRDILSPAFARLQMMIYLHADCHRHPPQPPSCNEPSREETFGFLPLFVCLYLPTTTLTRIFHLVSNRASRDFTTSAANSTQKEKEKKKKTQLLPRQIELFPFFFLSLRRLLLSPSSSLPVTANL